MQVAVIVGVLDRLVADVVGGAVDVPPLMPPPASQARVAPGVVVAAGRVLRPGTAAEFAGPDDQRFVEHAALASGRGSARRSACRWPGRAGRGS